MNLIKRLIKEEEGQGLVEYALILGLIAVVCVAVVTGLGTQIKTKLNAVISGLGGSPVGD